MAELFLYPILPAIIVGTTNWLYWKRQGFTSKVQLVMNIMLFYVGFFLLWKYIAY
ncbi:MAG: hypothetical protein QNK23_09920 [Crocinitomicaceae bacterium]|nr:hypothetical protein [Crocinitomicaceae bacterium]